MKLNIKFNNMCIQKVLSSRGVLIGLLLIMSTLTSCNTWLDVKPEQEEEEDDLFSTYEGYQKALTGCYMQMASQDIYGQHLTMDYVEDLVDQWYLSTSVYHPTDYYLMDHLYDNDNCKSAIKSIYQGLFNTIVQANMILKNIQNAGKVIASESTRKMIEGEAYAIRAYCQFDVLRLFGQMPSNPVTLVSLPYSENPSIKDYAPYYGFNDYVAKLESDLDHASTLLKESDPIFTYSFNELNNMSSSTSALQDDFLYYRQFNLNYWAVQALKARMYLYVGDTEKAHDTAAEIINATDPHGEAVMKLSGNTDLPAGMHALPHECLFELSKYNILDYSTNLLLGSGSANRGGGQYLLISSTMMNRLFSGRNTASNNRYNYQWNMSGSNTSDSKYPAQLKYSFSDDVSGKSLYYAVIPMLRMSEVYLIAIETAKTLSEANLLYKTYLESQNELLTTDAFASMDAVKAAMPLEYQREFIAEGQTFYAFKRFAVSSATKNGFSQVKLGEAEYLLPLPDTEYNPAEK
jgi:hypothetical protein